jgi:hypothetical protein
MESMLLSWSGAVSLRAKYLALRVTGVNTGVRHPLKPLIEWRARPPVS